jgi:hypothetical protein
MSNTYRQFSAWCKKQGITPELALVLAQRLEMEQRVSAMRKNLKSLSHPSEVRQPHVE